MFSSAWTRPSISLGPDSASAAQNSSYLNVYQTFSAQQFEVVRYAERWFQEQHVVDAVVERFEKLVEVVSELRRVPSIHSEFAALLEIRNRLVIQLDGLSCDFLALEMREHPFARGCCKLLAHVGVFEQLEN